jgi:predicted PhzF superfamily epimerase YddE/YHI9
MERSRTRVVFHTKSGPLAVERLSLRLGADDDLAMDLPAHALEPIDRPEVAGALEHALGRRPAATLRSRALVAVFDRAEDVRALQPDMAAVAALAVPEDGARPGALYRAPGFSAVSVTAPGTGPDADVDFVSRFFAPAKGVAEDPVTGSAHTALVPYWAARLGKDALRARQVSARGGELGCMLRRETGVVTLTGRAVVVVRGTMHV